MVISIHLFSVLWLEILTYGKCERKLKIATRVWYPIKIKKEKEICFLKVENNSGFIEHTIFHGE